MTIAVSITALLIGFFFCFNIYSFKLSKNKLLNLLEIFTQQSLEVICSELLVIMIYLFFFGGSGAVMRFVAKIYLVMMVILRLMHFQTLGWLFLLVLYQERILLKFLEVQFNLTLIKDNLRHPSLG